METSGLRLQNLENWIMYIFKKIRPFFRVVLISLEGKKNSIKGQFLLQELEVGASSGPYLLVIF